MGEITDIQLKFNCSENWDAMPNAEGGRHCDKCQKKVYDFTNSKADEFRQIIAENNGHVCGRFRIEQMSPEPIVLPFWKKWVSAAAMVLVGINLFSCEGNAHQQTLSSDTAAPAPAKKTDSQIKAATINQSDTIQKDMVGEVVVQAPVPAKQSYTASPNEIFNSVEILPEYKGGYEKFFSFIQTNLNKAKALKPGRANITFVVEKDGSLTNVRAVGRLLDEGATREAIRVVKLSPNWIPGKQNGKPVRVQYTVPIVFK